MKQSDNGITGSHRHDLNNLVGAGINANARPAAAQITTAVRAVISAAAIRNTASTPVPTGLKLAIFAVPA